MRETQILQHSKNAEVISLKLEVDNSTMTQDVNNVYDMTGNVVNKISQSVVFKVG